MKKIISQSVLLICFSSIIFAQGGNPMLLRMGIVDGNNIRSSFYNDGAFSGFNLGFDIRGEWPKGSGQFYLGDMNFVVGVELINTLGDTIHPVIIHRGPRRGQSDERHPLYSYFWGFNPVPGYFNLTEDKIAMSNLPNTWPSIWPDHPEYGANVWNGLFGANSFVGDVETYFKVDDTSDDEFNNYFLPDSSNPSMKGYGIRVFVRYIQVNHPLFKDVLFRVFDIKNEGQYDYQKVFWGSITGTLLGGDGDSGDDMAFINDDKNLVYAWDSDGVGNAGQKVAYIGEGLIAAPSGKKLGNFNYFPLQASPDMSNDSLLWRRFIPGKIDTLFPIPMDGDHLYGTNYFALAPNETKRVVMILGFAWDYNRLEQNYQFAKMLWNSNFQINEMLNKIKFNNLTYHAIMQGTSPITWSSNVSGGKVDLLFSSDLGMSWSFVDTSKPNTGYYSWNTNDFPDCSFGQLRIIVKDNLGNPFGYNDSHLFTINNSENGEPFIRIMNITEDTTIISDQMDIQIMVGDPESQVLLTKFYYSVNNGNSFTLFKTLYISPDTISVLLPLDIGKLQNSLNARIKVEVSDGYHATFDISERFSKQTERIVIDTQYVRHLSGFLNLPFSIKVVDQTQLTGHQYLLNFEDSSISGEKYFNVINKTTGQYVLNNVPLMANIENTVFDGLTLFAKDINTTFNENESGWNLNASSNYAYSFKALPNPDDQSISIGYPQPNDYQIVYYNTIVDTSIADTLYRTAGPPIIFSPTPVNFTIKNLSNQQKTPFVYRKTGLISSTHSIYFKESVKNTIKRTWRVVIINPTPNSSPIGGDTLSIVTKKGFSIYDTLAILSFPLGVNNNPVFPNEYYLSQNYPNPFNPITKINFSVPRKTFVTLFIYNILGEKEFELLNNEIEEGFHSIEFDASKLSTGVYFYQFKVGNFIQTKKMMLLR